MSSLVDKLRKTPAREVALRVFALDPGLSLVGWAYVEVQGTAPLVAPLRWTAAHFGLLRCEKKGLRPLAQVQRTIATIALRFDRHIESAGAVAVEAQQLYYKDDEGRDEVVGKGNDLIMLAQVTGAVQALALACHPLNRVLAYLPAEWKGQKLKSAMHEEYARQLDEARVSVHDHTADHIDPGYETTGLNVGGLPKMMHHGLDALCLGMVAATHLYRGGSL